MKRLLLLIVSVVFLAMPPAWAQAPQASSDELGAIKADVERIKTELEALKAQLGQVMRFLGQRGGQGGQAARGGPVRASVAGAPVLGRPDAPVTVLEFSDYQCPFCQQFFATTLPVIKKDYIDTGKVRYVFRDFPIERIHPQARKAAEAAHCAGDQGKYWEMHDVLYQNQQALELPQLAGHARTLGLDAAKFDECLSSGRQAARVAKGLTDGAAAGVNGTPAFVIAKTKPGDSVEGTPVVGAQPIEVFRQIIDQLLAEK